MREFTDQELIRREKAEKIREMGMDPFGNRFDRTAFNNAPYARNVIRNSGCPNHDIPTDADLNNAEARRAGTVEDCIGNSYTCRAVINKYTTSRY